MMIRHFPVWRGWALATLVWAAAGPASAQQRFRQAPEEPQWLKMNITQSSIGVYTEGTFEHTRFEGTAPVDYSRIFIGPSLGLGLQGSIYHPDCARLILDSEIAVGWAEDHIKSGASTSSRSELEQRGY